MATRYSVDVHHSSVGFSIKHMMISNVKGKFKAFSGTLEFDANKFVSLSALIEVNSIDTNEPKREQHLLSPDFFDEGNYPNISFRMTSYDNNIIVGDITIRDVTKSIKLDTEVHGLISSSGKKHLGFTMTGKLNRKDFGLNWNSIIEAGGVAVGEEVKLMIDIEAIEE